MKYGLIGEHLSHSFSKQIHEMVESYKYKLKELKPHELEKFLRAKEFDAINVTIPYKEAVIPYLDELDDTAKNVGAVNVIVKRNDKLIGHNSDVDGFIYLVKKSKIVIKDKIVLILGTGGASKAVSFALHELGAKSILFASRRANNDLLTYSEIYNHQEINVIVNTTPVGMYPNNNESLIDFDRFPSLEGFIDVIYNPINTISVVNARYHGVKAIGGLYMLVYQAIKSIELFLKKNIDEKIVDKVYRKILREHSNIVLIGMPTSGKSTIGKIIADSLNISLVDTDTKIKKLIKMPIKDFFNKFGEEEFREIEKEVVISIYQNTPQVIATGGGIIKDEENMKMLAQNGRIYFINRPLELLFASKDRPLSSSKEDLAKLYKERLPIYQKYMDFEIINDEGSKKSAKEILENEDFCD